MFAVLPSLMSLFSVQSIFFNVHVNVDTFPYLGFNGLIFIKVLQIVIISTFNFNKHDWKWKDGLIQLNCETRPSALGMSDPVMES